MALTAQQVQQFYIGYYGRPADPVGLTFWQTQTEAQALTGFAGSAEFTNQFTGLSTSQQVTKVYGNLLGRTPDVAGLLYWSGEITAGRETIGSLVLSMIKNALGKDVTTIADRVTYSTAFTAALNTTEEVNAYSGAAATQTARDALLKVTAAAVGDHTALTAETAKIDATIAAIVAGGSTNPGQTFTLTVGIDNFVGGAGNDMFIGGNGAANTTGPADQLDGGAGVDTFKFYGGTVTGALPTLKSIENLFFNSTTGTINAATLADVQSVEVNGPTGAHTVNLGAAQKLTLSDINTAAAGVATTVTGSAAGGITLNNVVDKSVTPNGAQTLNVNTRDTALSLNANGAASNIAMLSSSVTAAADMAALAKVTVTGDAKLTLAANVGYTNLTTVDAIANTGGVDFRQAAATDLTFTGGTGNDRVLVFGAVNAQDKLDGGQGTDTLAIANGGLTVNSVANVKNFEILEVRGTTGTPLTQDASVFDAQNSLTGLRVVNTGGAQTLTVNNLAATAKDDIAVNLDSVTASATTLTTTVKGFLNGGTSDTATLTVNAGGASTVAARSALNLTFDNVDVLNLVSKGAQATNGNQIAVTATDLEKLVVTGNIATAITTGVGTTGITEVDASGLVMASSTTTGLTFTQGAGATQSLLVTGSNGVDNVTVTSNRGTFIANGGNDTIAFTTAANAAAGSQSVNLSAKDFVGNGALNVNFAAFTAGGTNEVINFSSDIEAMLKIGNVVLGQTNANQTVGATINGQNNVAVLDVAGVATLQFDVNGDGNFNAADDFAITLTGLSTAGAGAITVTYDAAADWFVIA